MPDAPTEVQAPVRPSQRHNFWVFELSTEQVAQFDAAMEARGVEVERDVEVITRNLHTQTTETRVTGRLKRAEHFVEFRLEGAPHNCESQPNTPGCRTGTLTIGKLTFPKGDADEGERRLVDQVALAFPDTLAVSPELLNDHLNRMKRWKD